LACCVIGGVPRRDDLNDEVFRADAERGFVERHTCRRAVKVMNGDAAEGRCPRVAGTQQRLDGAIADRLQCAGANLVMPTAYDVRVKLAEHRAVAHRAGVGDDRCSECLEPFDPSDTVGCTAGPRGRQEHDGLAVRPGQHADLDGQLIGHGRPSRS
jgi:hypothetical protein